MDRSDAPIAEPRRIAVAREYDDVVAACRTRMGELGITFATLDDLSGVQSGYSAKLIGPEPTKNLGPMSFGAIMGALCMKWIAVEDPEALRRMRSRLSKRERPAHMPSIVSIPWLFNPLTAEKARELGVSKLTPMQRSTIARRAAVIRWERVRAAVREP